VKKSGQQNIYVIHYQDKNGKYYEKREIKEGVGVIFFEKLFMSGDGNYPMGYSLYYPETGYRNNIQINRYLPKVDQNLRYFGLAEYGHKGVLKRISATSDDAVYEFQGVYQDGSGIEDKFRVRYYIDYIRGTVTEQVVSNTRKNSPKEVNSKLHNIVILKTPFEQGNKWSHRTSINGKEYTVKSEIMAVDSPSGKITVRYTVEGVPGYFQNRYIEERTFEPSYGLTGFSNLMPGNIDISPADMQKPEKLNEAIINHMFGYSLDKNN
jgi:hypothetical protein